MNPNPLDWILYLNWKLSEESVLNRAQEWKRIQVRGYQKTQLIGSLFSILTVDEVQSDFVMIDIRISTFRNLIIHTIPDCVISPCCQIKTDQIWIYLV